MSFNANDHINTAINRSNYEEYFLLYIDNELPAKERKAVEDFAAAHPDLKEELDILLSTKITIETVSFNKEDLLSPAMQSNETEEQLLLYIDDELGLQDKITVEQKINTNEKYGLQYALLQKAKLDRNETIVFPYKKNLYHSPVFTISTLYKIAAIVLIVLGTALWLLGPHNPAQNEVVKVNKNPTVHRPAAVQPSVPATPLPVEPGKDLSVIHLDTNKEKIAYKGKSTTLPKLKSAITKQTPYTASQPQAVALTKRPQPVTHKELPAPFPAPVDTKEINTPSVVTSNPSQTYNITEAAETATNLTAAVAGNNAKQKVKLNGFLRKATHFIERTTHIDPANDDGTLLIGAVSFKVK